MNNELRFYNENLIVHTLFADEQMIKLAQSGIMSGIISKMKEYFSNQIDPNDKTGSLLNLIAPGAISMVFSAMGLGRIGIAFSLAMRIFHIDVNSIFHSIYDSLKGDINSGKKLSSSEIQTKVDNAVQEHTGDAMAPTGSLKEIKLLKLSLMTYEHQIMSSQPIKISLGKGGKGAAVSAITAILSWFFKIALASAGLMVAGDIVNKVLDRPNAFDGTVHDGHPVDEVSIKPEVGPISTQTKFKVNPGYTNNVSSSNWTESVPNTESGIENLIVGFVHEVYNGVNDAEIKASNGFKKIVDDIAWYNHAAVGDQVVFIPKNFSSKKQLVDHFIDEVAAKSA